VLVLLGGAIAQAQTAPTREPRRRSVTLTGAPIEARIATGSRTFLVFGVPIRGEAAEVDRARIKVVDTGEVTLVIEPLSEPRPGERWTLRVPLADGKAPEVAEFALVAHPSEVDAEIDVARAEKPGPPAPPACAPCAPMSAATAITSGLIDERGVQTRQFDGFTDSVSGLESRPGMSYRAASWVLVDVTILRPPRHSAWRPARATLTSKSGEARVWGVRVELDKQRPQQVRVLVETDVPPPGAGLEFTLHLHGAAGAPSLSIPMVNLPPTKELK
jgi:hypothetical protein